MSGNRRQDAFGYDAYQGFRAWRLWSALGWNDIRQRYRRSVLGPFWITISMAVLVAVLGYIYSHIFKMEIQTYLPFLALGFIFWGFLSSTITESCEAFRENNRIIKQIKVPYSVHILRVLWRNLIVLLHTISIFIPISIIFSLMPSPDILLVIPGLLMLCINLAWLGLFLAVSARVFATSP
jgi:ABC-type polysaccharide/polyol phosphate export permease